MAASAVFVGLTTLDIVYSVDAYPAENKKIVAGRQGAYAGGPATNAAVTFAHLGGRGRLISAKGTHPVTALIAEDLRAARVEHVDVAGAGFVPSVSSIMVSAITGSRTVVSTNAVGKAAKPEEFDGSLLDGASMVLVDGHTMEVAIAAARHARRLGIEVVLDGGSWKSGTDRLLPHVDVAICSADFVPPHLTGANSEAVLEYLAAVVHVAAITRGERTILFRDRSERGEVPTPTTNVVDTLGAGDVFHGAFCYFRCQAPNAPLAETLRRAAHIAAFSCRYFGPREWMRHLRSSNVDTGSA